MRLVDILLMICLVGIGVACENPLDSSPNILPKVEEEIEEEEGGAIIECSTEEMGVAEEMMGGEMMGGEMMDETSDTMNNEADNTSCGPCPDCPQIGTWYRFDELQVTALDGDESHPIINTLNMIWTGDIERNQLNILFEVVDKNENEIRISALNAAFLSTEKDDFCLLPETKIEFVFNRDQVNGCGFTNPTPSGINIYAGSQEIPKNCAPNLELPHSIPVRNTILEGSFSRSCDRIKSGNVVSAAIPKTQLGNICTCLAPQLESCKGPNPNYEGNLKGECVGCESSYLMSLESQLGSFQPLKFECEANGDPAVCLSATFSAQRLAMTPDICP